MIMCRGITWNHEPCDKDPWFRVYGKSSEKGVLACMEHLAEVVRSEAQGGEVRVTPCENPLRVVGRAGEKGTVE
jgi:hypothetical protein